MDNKHHALQATEDLIIILLKLRISNSLFTVSFTDIKNLNLSSPLQSTIKQVHELEMD